MSNGERMEGVDGGQTEPPHTNIAYGSTEKPNCSTSLISLTLQPNDYRMEAWVVAVVVSTLHGNIGT